MTFLEDGKPENEVSRLCLINHGLHMLQRLLDVYFNTLFRVRRTPGILWFNQEKVFLVHQHIANTHLLIDLDVAQDQFTLRLVQLIALTLDPICDLPLISSHRVFTKLLQSCRPIVPRKLEDHLPKYEEATDPHSDHIYVFDLEQKLLRDFASLFLIYHRYDQQGLVQKWLDIRGQ